MRPIKTVPVDRLAATIQLAKARQDPFQVSVSLVRTGPELPTGIDTGIRLATDDAPAARAAVAAAGLDVGDLLDWPDVPLMFSFADPDGNRFYVSEASAP